MDTLGSLEDFPILDNKPKKEEITFDTIEVEVRMSHEDVDKGLYRFLRTEDRCTLDNFTFFKRHYYELKSDPSKQILIFEFPKFNSLK